jgi:uncharacterized membrane protein YkvA (DUF1232 family)
MMDSRVYSAFNYRPSATILKVGSLAGREMRRLFRLWQLTGRDLRVLLHALRQPDRPVWLMPAALLLVFFAIEPLNLAFPVLGVVDDFVLLPLLLRGLVGLAVPALRTKRDDRVVSEQ